MRINPNMNRLHRRPRRQVTAKAGGSSQPMSGGPGRESREELLRSSNHIGKAEKTFARIKLDAKFKGGKPFCEEEFRTIKRLASVIQLDNLQAALLSDPQNHRLRAELEDLKKADEEWGKASPLNRPKINDLQLSANQQAVQELRHEMLEADDMNDWRYSKKILDNFVDRESLPAPLSDAELLAESELRKFIDLKSAEEFCQNTNDIDLFSEAIAHLKQLCDEYQWQFPFSDADINTRKNIITKTELFRNLEIARDQKTSLTRFEACYKKIQDISTKLKIPPPITEAEAAIRRLILRLICRFEKQDTIGHASTPVSLEQAMESSDMLAIELGFERSTQEQRDQYRTNLTEKIGIKLNRIKHPQDFSNLLDQLNELNYHMEGEYLAQWETALQSRYQIAKMENFSIAEEIIRHWEWDIFTFEENYKIFALYTENQSFENPISNTELKALRKTIAQQTIWELQHLAINPNIDENLKTEVEKTIMSLTETYKVED